MKVVANNKKARHDYFIEETYEAGIALTGTEIKSVRQGKVSIKESYAKIENEELILYGMNISPYEQGNRFNVDPLRPRRLLLHKREIRKLIGYTKLKGLTLVPLRMYINDRGKAKVDIAAGRRPYTDGLICDESSEEVKQLKMEKGRIVVDENYETSVPGIDAIGDAIGGIQLAHVASAEGRNAAAHIAGSQPPVRMNEVPSCVYTDPEIACVGITADDAKEAGIKVIARKYPMSGNGKSVLTQQERGFIKIIADAESEKILGAQMMCARATDMISQFSQAIASELTLDDMSKFIYPHPTFCEGIGKAAGR